MSSSKTAFIVNPNAGNGSTGTKWPFIKTLAENRLGSFMTHITAGPGDATVFAKDAVSKGIFLIVCVGGDGTLNEVVNGLMEHEESFRADLTIGFIPNGTGCDFIRTVAIPRNINEAIDIIAARNVRSIDLGRLVFRDHKGSECRRYFHNIASFGLGGEVAQRVNNTTKLFGPFFSFIRATLISIFLYGKKQIYLKIDNGNQQMYSIWNVAVANGRYHGGGMLVAPDASVDDGLLNITLIGDLSLAGLFIHLPKLYNGKIKQVDKVITFTGKRIEVTSDQRVLLDVDGEQPGTLPVVIDVVPKALNIITAK
ncbi:MAG: diacylglycerol kinase family lipid kinase [Desulfobacteraceae bacterium]|uniref:Diacylglycerol kinase family lipid kinase n=1 Tax=Candidatus Desulfaltia bathyphila TaxID=2841697 RepID=A0A8J6TC53_9BACT|nr:diacylglycerol kinase family lipid kinase [Candidatus Desulfaltia bathyphila]